MVNVTGTAVDVTSPADRRATTVPISIDPSARTPAAAHGTTRRHPDRAGVMAGAPASSGAPPSSSSIRTRASPMSRNRALGSFVRQRVSRRRSATGVEAGKAPHSGSFNRTAASVVGDVVALEGPAAGQHLVEHAAERPDVGALVDRLALGLLRRHVGRGAEDHPAHGHRRRRDGRRVREARRSPPGGGLKSRPSAAGSSALASPKSSTFTTPSARSLMLAGLRSRWMIPCSWAASSASAICLAMGRASSSGIAPRAMPLRQILTLDQFHHQRPDAAVVFEAVDVGDVRVVQRRQRLGFAGEPGEPFGVAGEEIGHHLDRDIAVERRVTRPIDLAHAAGAEEGQHLVRSDSGAGRNRHWLGRTILDPDGTCWPARQRPSACRYDGLAARLDRQPTIEAARRMAIHPAARTLSRFLASIVNVRKSTLPVRQNSHSPAMVVASSRLPVSRTTTPFPVAGSSLAAVLIAGSLLPSWPMTKPPALLPA